MPAKAKKMFLFTNRNALVFDDGGEQIPEYQAAITCYSLNESIARKAIDEAEEFYIAKFREWCNPITKKEMTYLLGLAKRETE